MKKILTWCLFFSFAFSTTYYLDATNGNDFNSGTSPEKAWKNIKKLISFKFKPGDKIAFKRGEVFRGYFIVSSSGKKNKPIIFTSYGEGELPVITSMVELPGSKIEDNFKKEKRKNLWSFNLPFHPQRIMLNNKEVLRAGYSEKEIDGKKIFWFWKDKKLYLYSRRNPASEYESIKVNLRYETILLKDKHDIIFENIAIEGGNGYSIAIRGCYDIIIRNCKIGAYGRMGIQIMDNNVGGRYVPSHDILVENCVIDSKFDFTYEAPSTRGSIDGIYINNGAHNCVIRNNKIKNWGHTGINIVAINPLNPGVYNNKFYNNVITAENISYGRGIGVDGIEGKAHHNEFFYNIIKNTTVRSQLNGDHNHFHHNVIDTVKNSPVKPYGTAQGIEIQGYGKDYVSHDNKIDNNIIINCDEAGIRIRAGNSDKYNNLIRNNIIYDCGLNSKDDLPYAAIIVDNHESVKRNGYLNNCIYNSKGVKKSVHYRGKFLTVKEFNAQSGYDKISRNIQKDPKFVNARKRDFHLLPSSPCIDAGVPIEKKRYFKGKAPDIGLYEER